VNKNLIVLIGPTAVGKTKQAILIAKELNTEILSADSRQFYKELSIGVASPSEEELSEIKHHFIKHISIKESYNAGLYEKDAMEKIEELFKKYDNLVLTGGSGMYVDAICNGMDCLPNSNETIREELNNIYKTKGLLPLQEELQKKDPKYYGIVDINNPVRLIRALDVIYQTNKPYSSFLNNRHKKRDFAIIKFGLLMDRPLLIERINKRVDNMIEEGLITEAKQVYHFKDFPALNTVGYKELFEYFEGKVELSDAIEKIKTNTRRYAKRQMTWFRKDNKINWIPYSNNIDWKCILEKNI
jgi:tRNA dimethylallyltransferase